MWIFTDELSVIIIPNNLSIGRGTIAQFMAIVDGINTSESNFVYQWTKRSNNSLPDKVSGINETVLTIPNALESDEGQYYCTVTNEWDRSVESNDVTLFTFGMYISVFTCV